MKRRRRIYYSAVQRSEIWDHWQAGGSMSSVGRRFDRESSSVFSVVSPTGACRYLPRGIDLSLYGQAKLSAIARQRNERPRKTLLFQTPAEKFAECVAAIS